MKHAIFLILMFSVTLAFAQTDQSADSPNKENDKESTTTVKAKKVSEIRHVVIKGNVQMAKDMQESKQIKRDAKGEIVIPNANKGVKQQRLTAEQKTLMNNVQRAQRHNTKTTVNNKGSNSEQQSTKKAQKENKRNE